MKKILLIGGEGYIGNTVSKVLLSKGYAVESYDNFLYGNNICATNKSHQKNYRFIYGDMNDSKKLKKFIERSDAVVLLAGLVGDPITKNYPNEAKIINDYAVINVINICAELNTSRLIFISTCSNYGLVKNEKLSTEDSDLNPLSLYAKSKVRAEKHLLSLCGKTKMSATILRFATAFGMSSRMRFDLTVNEFTREIACGKNLTVYDANTWRPYCHVKDFGRLIETVIQAPNELVDFEVFNSGGDKNNATKQMIVDNILKRMPSGYVEYLEKGIDTRNYKVSFEKVKTVLGFEPKYSIQNGIDEIIYAFKNNVFKNVNENKNFHGNYKINYNGKF